MVVERPANRGLPRRMSKVLRNELLKVPVVVYEKKQIDRQAREADLNTADYIREKLGLGKVYKSRTAHKRNENLEDPQGDPENAVDVEELARELFNGLGRSEPSAFTMAEARREAKRRLAE